MSANQPHLDLARSNRLRPPTIILTEFAGPSSGHGSSAPNMLVLPHDPRMAQIPAPRCGGLAGREGRVLFFMSADLSR